MRITQCASSCVIVVHCLLITMAGAQETAVSDQSADDAAIRANVEAYVKACNRRDAKTMASMWMPEAVYLDPSTNEQIIGREAIAKHFDTVFSGADDTELSVAVASIDFVSPNVAVERGSAVVRHKELEPEKTTYTAVHVKLNGEWLLDRITEVEVPPAPPSSYEHLKELEWMVGSWIDREQGATVQTDCAWTRNRNFMTRSFAVVVGDEVHMAGMQIIGWDPAAMQIRSWVFDSDGSFSEGKWSRKDDRWFVEQVGTLPDGTKATATNIITRIDADSFTWQSVHRTVDGELRPNVDEVLIMRNPQVEGNAVSVAPADIDSSHITVEGASGN